MNLSTESGSVIRGYGSRTIWMLRAICVAGLGISAYLAWTALQMGEVFGCGSDGSIFNCSHVLTSKWSKVLGIPVSVPAFGLYASMLMLLSFARMKAPTQLHQWVWSAMTLGSLLAGFAALWFIGLQIFVLKHLCWYCLTVHTCGLVLTVMMLRGHYLTTTDKSRLAMVAMAGVAGLMTIQIMSREEDHFEVVNFEDLPASTESIEATDDIASSDMFAAPGEEVFEAPGSDIFEAPGSENDSASETLENTPPTASAPVNVESVQPAATTVLTILLPKFGFLTQMPVTFQDGGSAVQETKNEASKPADSTPAEQPKDDAAAATNSQVNKTVTPEIRKVTVASNRMTLNALQWPILGTPEAEVIFVEMFDYTCPHCRSTHNSVKGALSKYGNKVAILALPVPLETKCNPTASGGGHAGACDLAKIAITVWRVDSKKFPEFHDWLFENHVTPTTARKKAEQLVGVDAFRKEFDSKIPAEYIKRHIELYKKVGSGSVPKLIFEKSMLNGSVNSRESLCAAIEREYPQL